MTRLHYHAILLLIYGVACALSKGVIGYFGAALVTLLVGAVGLSIGLLLEVVSPGTFNANGNLAVYGLAFLKSWTMTRVLALSIVLYLAAYGLADRTPAVSKWLGRLGFMAGLLLITFATGERGVGR